MGWAAKAAGVTMLSGPLCLVVEVYLRIPSSWPKAWRAKALAGTLLPTGHGTGDVDNFAKLVGDALNRIAYEDDSQIVEARVTKRYSEYPRMVVEVRELL